MLRENHQAKECRGRKNLRNSWWLLVTTQFSHDRAVGFSISENTSYNHMSAPEDMTNNFAAAKIINGKPQVAVAFICFKQSVVCVRSKKLGGKKRRNFHVNISKSI